MYLGPPLGPLCKKEFLRGAHIKKMHVIFKIYSGSFENFGSHKLKKLLNILKHNGVSEILWYWQRHCASASNDRNASPI